MEFKQGTNFVDVIIPLIRATKLPDNKLDPNGLYGTGFLIGNRGFGITCAHVIEQLENGKSNDQYLITEFRDNIRKPYFLKDIECHDEHDVAVFRVDSPELKSWFHIINTPENSAVEYHSWGYPCETAKEPQKIISTNYEFPELIFTQGYVRRRIDRVLTSSLYRGNSFYEISEQAGSCYSGSPIIKKKSVGKSHYKIFGIYVGERDGQGPPVSYAVNSQCFADWRPSVLGGTSIMEESLNTI